MKSKLKSRKFLVFIIWLIITVYLVIVKQDTTPLQYFFVISAIYIGGQATIDGIEKLKK